MALMKASREAPAGPVESHWDQAYRHLTPSGVSWHQPSALLSLEIVDALMLARDTSIIDAGGGASTLVDGLLERNFSDITVVDISTTALEAARERVGTGAPVRWLHQDLLAWQPDRRYGLWHDRAVYHFLTGHTDRATYRRLVNRAVQPGGYAILATFAPDGPDRCSGLPVARYGPGDLARELGPGFRVFGSYREEHVTPSGAVQPFTWVVAQRLEDEG